MTQTHPQDGLVVGVDVGGTKVAAGLVDSGGQIVKHVRTPMSSNGTAADGLAAVTAAVDSLLKANDDVRPLVKGIGICAPGPLDPQTGMVINPPNLPCWRNFPLARTVSELYSLPVKVDNDANAAALAEAQWGAGRGFRNVFYATIGTGIGTGIVFDGRIYHGRTGAAGEGGHVSIDYTGPRCRCGKLGCIEALAAGPAIAERARLKLATAPARESILRDLAHGDVSAVSSEMVWQASAEGDAFARDIVHEEIQLLAYWLGNIVDLLDPDVVIIGGGVGTMLNPYFGEMKDRLPQCCVNSRCQEIPILKARYGADAGIAGGAALCWG